MLALDAPGPAAEPDGFFADLVLGEKRIEAGGGGVVGLVAHAGRLLQWVNRRATARDSRAVGPIATANTMAKLEGETTWGLEEVFGAVGSGILLLDRGGSIVYANGAAERLFGVPAERLIGQRLVALYSHLPDFHTVLRTLRMLESGGEYDFFVPHPKHGRLAAVATGRSLELSGGPRLLVITWSDVHRQVQAEQDAREQVHEIASFSDTVIEQALALDAQSHILEAKVRERTRELDEAYMEAITMLAVASEAKDADTGAHVRRIQRYAEALARERGLPKGLVDRIGYSAILHDVGKMQVPDEILKKPGSLTESERDEIQRHTLVGERILSRLPFFDEARRIARSHHENWDGSGYPDGLAGEAIPLSARIVRLVDVFDGLTSRRAYKPAWSPEVSAEYIQRGAGTLFDPALVRHFETLFQRGEFARLAEIADLAAGRSVGTTGPGAQ